VIFKICGLREKDALICCEANNVDFFGLVFYEKSPRNINHNEAKQLVEFSKNLAIKPVGVFVNHKIDDLIDIIKLLNTYHSSENLKLVGGIRQKRKDRYIKIIASKIANRVRSFILRDKCPDTGCSLKIFDKEIFLSFPFFSGIHRFLPALYKSFGHKTAFINVDHRIRKAGKSKYGVFDRLLIGIIDIFKVIIIINNIKNND